ncbi:MAG TPA: phosphatidylcholine/phosphatidylserine synthase [Planctomycetota bacterium]|nr:phosphatidylcholine/phosphatidylserine synthase [Planctomycetota bacterium]
MARFPRFRLGRHKSDKPRRLLQGIHPIPTMVTLGNLICGFASILLSMRANNLPAHPPEGAWVISADDYLYLAGLLIFVAMIFDVLDGSVARLTKSTSKFGMEMDSLCDVVSFGVAPAVLVKNLLDLQAGLGKPYPMLDRYMFPLLVIYVCCAALRLARYNVESESGHRSFFFGMPSPGAAGCAASLVILSIPASHHWQRQISPLNDQVTQLEKYLDVVRDPIMIALPFIMLALGILMVSRVHYQHIGDRILKGRKSLMHLLVLVIALSLVVMHHEIMLAVGFNGYMIYGLLNELRYQLFPKHRPAEWNVPMDGEVPAQPVVPVPVEKQNVPPAGEK